MPQLRKPRGTFAPKSGRIFTPNGLLLLALCGGVGVPPSARASAPGSVPFGFFRAAPKGALTLIAGRTGGAGSADGAGPAARLNGPRNMSTDAAGNMFLADAHRVLRATAAGAVTTLAGSETLGQNDGTGSAAGFYIPTAAAVDGAGNVYVADSYNSVIRKVTSAGVVSTFAGSPGNVGSADGTGSAARFYFPSGVAVDGSGNVFVADTYNYAVRKITPAGVVSTFAGSPGTSGTSDGTGTAARFNLLQSLTVDGSGNVFVADTSSHTLRKVTSAGVVTTLAGSPGTSGTADGTGTAARFWRPAAVTNDGSGNLFVADSSNHTLRKVTAAGAVTTVAGSAGTAGSTDGTGSAARFSSPAGVTVDASGNCFVADTKNTLRKVTPGGVVTTLAGLADGSGATNGTGSAATFYGPQHLAVDSSGNVYVADRDNGLLRKVTPTGVVTTLASNVGPAGVALDGAGNVFLSTTTSDIKKVTSAGVVSKLAGSGSDGYSDGNGIAAEFGYPQQIAIDGGGNIFVADTDNNVIRKVTLAGDVTTFAGSGSAGSTDGTTSAQFNRPQGVAFDPSGNLYVADTGNGTVRKITPGGAVTTFAGTAQSFGTTDGTGTAARFKSPSALAADAAGNLYVADNGNYLVRKITSSGQVTTVLGSALRRGVTLGPVPASLNTIGGIAASATKLFLSSENSILTAPKP